MTEPAPHRLFLIDDHAIVRQGIAALLAREAEFTICGEAGTFAEGLQGVLEKQPDAVLLDLSLRDQSGLDLLVELRKAGFTRPVLVLSMHDETLYAPKAIHAGAQGYVMKDRADETLLEALHTVLAGGTHLSENIRLRMQHEEAVPADAEPDEYGLTSREKEILLAIGEGLSTRAIAERFGLSGRTVEVHRANIRKKVGGHSHAELLIKAMEYRRQHVPETPAL